MACVYAMALSGLAALLESMFGVPWSVCQL
jgi:hypothetical protein